MCSLFLKETVVSGCNRPSNAHSEGCTPWHSKFHKVKRTKSSSLTEPIKIRLCILRPAQSRRYATRCSECKPSNWIPDISSCQIRLESQHLMPAVVKKTNKLSSENSCHIATDFNRHVRLSAAVVWSDVSPQVVIKYIWLLPGMSGWCVSSFHLLLSCSSASSSDASYRNPPAFILWLLHMFALRSAASTHDPTATRISQEKEKEKKKINVWNSATEIVLLAVVNCDLLWNSTILSCG